ncbi:Ribosomal protein S5 domain 2-type fold subgroup [Penicillium verhagenii]|uniref:Ribosomal protein S5 domain 2-type fold subgroup n=1 Tax=Penicillium verhagenii TaxID=1562060 RepID=UPI0025454171|nr:Ribosomal protein S5 domain 2-type fold subgroup [Penicillium verhagenii]KAJ5936885.1 Ribosomal protein S5 domain 2-type fold subgroup [Penicillium verhagenii]
MTIAPYQKITLQVPAKINPQIRVGPLRQDGYHDITLAYQAISLYDSLTITHNPEGPTMTVTGMDSDRVPNDSRNLVIKAAALLAKQVGVSPRLHFELSKMIPSEAGLGGGSADAAAALVGCNLMWGSTLDDDELMELGAQIGEDVPFFINGMMALGLGHKQPLIPLEVADYPWIWVLAVPTRGLSTKGVFQEYDSDMTGSLAEEEEAYTCRRKGCIDTPWGTTPPMELLSSLVNDLEVPSSRLLPDIGVALEAGRAFGAAASLMCGSGSTCAFLARDEAHAVRLRTELQKMAIFREVMVAAGPVEGVKVIEASR